MVTYTVTGNFKRTKKLLEKGSKLDLRCLDKYARRGVEALAASTPKRSGKTSSSWSYEIVRNGDGAVIYWKNSNINKGVSIAMILQFGHGTGTGGYVQGIDYINPALRPVFEGLAQSAWEEVSNP